MIRTQEEILKRIEDANDMFGVQRKDLIVYLTYENVKPFLKDELIEKIESGEDGWELFTDPKAEILNYLGFAYQKAENERGLSAMRSMYHFDVWVWLDDDEFYNSIKDEMQNYTNYGIPVLDKISKHYGYVK